MPGFRSRVLFLSVVDKVGYENNIFSNIDLYTFRTVTEIVKKRAVFYGGKRLAGKRFPAFVSAEQFESGANENFSITFTRMSSTHP